MISLIVTLSAVALYLVGYTITSVIFIRTQRWDQPRCHGPLHYRTQGKCARWDYEGCWRPGPRTGEVALGLIAPLVWPIAIFPATAYFIATKPQSKRPDLEWIERTERELGVGGKKR